MEQSSTGLHGTLLLSASAAAVFQARLDRAFAFDSVSLGLPQGIV